MRIRVQDLTAGDVILLHDWELHVVTIERDRAIGMLTAEFGFLLHYLRDEVVDVQAPVKAA